MIENIDSCCIDGRSLTLIPLSRCEGHLCNMGTYGYMAPEAEYDDIRSTKSDIYSLGACVRDMCREYRSIICSFLHLSLLFQIEYLLIHFRNTARLSPLNTLLTHMTSSDPEDRPSAVDALTTLRSSCMTPELKKNRTPLVDASITSLNKAKRRWNFIDDDEKENKRRCTTEVDIL